jgi:hypothetical protein
MPPDDTPSRPQLPPGLVLYQMSIGHYVSRALALVVKLSIADLLADGPRDADDLAAATDTHAPSLRRVLRLLVSMGVFAEDDAGRFALEALGELLRADVEGSMSAMVSVFAGVGIQDSWKELEYCVRTGNPAFRKDAPDADAFAQMAEDPEQAATFDKAMATFAPRTAAAVAAAYDFTKFGTVADIGGGNGALLIGILKACPRLKGIVFDQEHVAERARAHLAAAGMADRCQVVAGSFFGAVPPGAEAYLMKHVLHDWDDRRAGAILGACRKVMTPDARLLVVEGLYPPRVDHSLMSRAAAANDVNMLVVAGGRQRSEAEFRELFEASGFSLTSITPAENVCVIEGEPV